MNGKYCWPRHYECFPLQQMHLPPVGFISKSSWRLEQSLVFFPSLSPFCHLLNLISAPDVRFVVKRFHLIVLSSYASGSHASAKTGVWGGGRGWGLETGRWQGVRGAAPCLYAL